MKQIVSVFVFLLFCASASLADIKTGSLPYKDRGVELEGYYAYPDSLKQKQPGILIVHAWKGLTEYEKRRAREIAALGYVAFALDMYGKSVRVEGSEDAAKRSGEFKNDRKLMRRRAQAGLDALTKLSQVDKNNVAVMGYCFGGGVALELARSGADVDGAVSFHGNLATPTPNDARRIKGKVLVLHGANDPYVTQDEVRAFQDEMSKAKVNWKLIQYSGAVHAFTDPGAGSDLSKGAAYNAEADRYSWEALKTFLEDIFKKN